MLSDSFWWKAWRMVTFSKPEDPKAKKVSDLEVVDPFERFEAAIRRDSEETRES